jgi:hypothetical protein
MLNIIARCQFAIINVVVWVLLILWNLFVIVRIRQIDITNIAMHELSRLMTIYLFYALILLILQYDIRELNIRSDSWNIKWINK